VCLIHHNKSLNILPMSELAHYRVTWDVWRHARRPTSCIAWADPDRQLVFVYMTNLLQSGHLDACQDRFGQVCLLAKQGPAVDLTSSEVHGLMAGVLVSRRPATRPTSFSSWLRSEAPTPAARGRPSWAATSAEGRIVEAAREVDGA
jgi:hypothetical protein